ncbi:MAG: hypothetical protein K6B28_04600 [Lachnospiraceae bacterium]|nr:hypothetical protein [Lachnospiraceae bacterium]
MKIDDFSRMLILNDDTRIPIDDIISINSPVFNALKEETSDMPEMIESRSILQELR